MQMLGGGGGKCRKKMHKKDEKQVLNIYCISHASYDVEII